MNHIELSDISSQSEMSFQEILWKLLEQWKMVLVFALIISLLFSGVQYRRALQGSQASAQINNALQSKSEEEILSELSEEERGLVSSLINLYRTKESLNQYIAGSVYMHLNPAAIRCANVVFAIDTDEANVNTLADYYVTALKGSEIRNRISNALDGELSCESVGELTTVNLDSKSSSGVVSYYLYLPESISSEKVLETVQVVIDEIFKDKSQDIGDHEIKILTSEESVVTDFNVTRAQADTYSYLNNMTNQMSNLLSNCSTAQKAVYEKLLNRENGKEIADTSLSVKLFNQKDLLTGLLLGIIIYIISYLVWAIFSRRIQNHSYLKTAGGIRNLGEWYSGLGKGFIKRFMNSRVIYRLHHKNHLDRSTEIEKAVDVIRSTCKHQNLSKILFVITEELSPVKAAFVQSIEDELKSDDVRIDKEIFIQRKGIRFEDDTWLRNQAVVLIVDADGTRLDDLDSVVEQSGYYDVSILGSVYLG